MLPIVNKSNRQMASPNTLIFWPTNRQKIKKFKIKELLTEHPLSFIFDWTKLNFIVLDIKCSFIEKGRSQKYILNKLFEPFITPKSIKIKKINLWKFSFLYFLKFENVPSCFKELRKYTKIMFLRLASFFIYVQK